MPDRSPWLLRLAARLVPAWRRREFLAEWQAELDWDGAAGARPGWQRLSGALADAVALRLDHWRAVGLSQDVRLAIRLAVRRPTTAALIVVTMALGLGGTTAVFSVVNAVLLRPLPYENADDLVVIWEDDRLSGRPRTAVSPGVFADWTTAGRSFSAFLGYFAGSANLSAGADSARVAIGSVSPNVHELLGVRPILGPGFTSDESSAEHQDLVLVSHAAWQTRFGADPSLVGRDVVLNDTPRRVAGIMPRDFFLFDPAVEFWVPFVPRARAATIRNVGLLTVVGRLQEGVSIEQARLELDLIAASAANRFPETSRHRGVTLVPIRDQVFGEITRPLVLVSAAVAMVLLTGCANVANLLLATGVARRRELAVRTAVGASRLRIVRQLLVETTVLSAAGGLLGIALALGAANALGSATALIVPGVGDVSPDWRVFVFGATATGLVGLGVALLPAITASRAEVSRDIAGGGRAGMSPALGRIVAGLVVSEFVVAVLLVSGASLAVRSFRHAQAVDVGIDVPHLLTAQVTLPVSRFFGVQPIVDFYDQVEGRLQAVPGVRASGVIAALPLGLPDVTDTVAAETSNAVGGEPPRVSVRPTTPGFFPAAGVPLVEGRLYDATDRAGGPGVAVVNRAFVAAILPNGRPIGQRIQLGTRRGQWRTVIGVVGDVRHDGPERPAAPAVYVPMAQGYAQGSAAIVVGVSGEPGAFIPALRAATAAVDPQVPLSAIRPMRDLAGDAVLGRRAATALLGTLAGLTLVLALVGAYGMLAHRVGEQTRDLGVRLALGADRRRLMVIVLRQGLTLAAVGLAVGHAVAYVGGRLARSMLFGVDPGDPMTFVIVTVTTLATAAVSCYFPARRAARLDPLVVLRR